MRKIAYSPLLAILLFLPLCFLCTSCRTGSLPQEIISVMGFDEEPQFPGGIDSLYSFINQHLHLPTGMEEYKGEVQVRFVVEKDGSLGSIQVSHVRTQPPMEIEKEAIHIVELMPHWIPAKYRGKPVRVGYMLPITFGLKE